MRRANQIRTIQGSLAIEGNSLSVEQITAVLEGKPVIAPPKEVQEVKNALAVYEQFDRYDPGSEADLLDAHRLLVAGLVDEAGRYRSGGVGVMSDKAVVHMVPPASQLPRLMTQLFAWLNATEHPPLVASTAATDRAPFVEFMLAIIHQTLVQPGLGNELGKGLGNELGKRLGKELSAHQQSILRLMRAEPRIHYGQRDGGTPGGKHHYH